MGAKPTASNTTHADFIAQIGTACGRTVKLTAKGLHRIRAQQPQAEPGLILCARVSRDAAFDQLTDTSVHLRDTRFLLLYMRVRLSTAFLHSVSETLVGRG